MSQVPQRVGKYELQELLGQGGMAEVWKAFDTQLHRYVAVKLLHANLQADPDFVSRFTHEAQVVAALHHPNIIQIYDFHTSETAGTAETLAYMVMEYIKGQTLAHYINATSRQMQFPSTHDIIQLFTPISLALDYAHRQGTIHRDIKPANILLDQENRRLNKMGEPILSDFGLAKVMDAPSQTMAGFVLGTPLYISPEQVQNKVLSNRTDLYALGIILYETFASKPPFFGASSSQIMLQRVTETPADPRNMNANLSQALAEVLLKSVARDPQDRFPTAATMIAAVAVASNLPIPEDLRLAMDSADAALRTFIAVGSDNDDDVTTINVSPATIFPIAKGTDVAVNSDDATVVHVDTDPDDMLAIGGGDSADKRLHLPDSEALSRNVTTDATGEISSLQAARASDVDLQAPEDEHSGVEAQNGVIAEQTVAARAIAATQFAPLSDVNPTESFKERVPASVLPTPLIEKRKHQRRRITIVALLVGVLIIAASGALFFRSTAHQTATHTASSTNTTDNQAFFLSKVNLKQDTAQGNNSQLEIDLKAIPVAQAGDSYYTWLLPDKNQPEKAPILLGKIAVKNGNVHFVYVGDNNSSDLLANTSRFLITEESSAITPDIPSPDFTAWRYYAEIPQTVPANQQYSLLDHIRHLLSDDPTLMALHLSGGLDIWADRNTNAVYQWSKSAQSSWQTKNFTMMHQNIVSMLDYIDGTAYVKQDVPAGTPLYVNRQYAQVGLLEFDPTKQDPPSYLYHIALHLNGVISSPGSTAYQRSIAVQVNSGINSMRIELGQSRQDAIQLVHMNHAQLTQPSTQVLLNDLVTQANMAYAGQVDASTHEVKKIGMIQIYQFNQRLATFTIQPYHS